MYSLSEELDCYLALRVLVREHRESLIAGSPTATCPDCGRLTDYRVKKRSRRKDGTYTDYYVAKYACRFCYTLPSRVSGAIGRTHQREPMFYDALQAQVIEMFERQQRQCAICGTNLEGNPWHLDHIMPVVHGGTSNIDNLQALCVSCNLSKKDHLPMTAVSHSRPGVGKRD